MVTYINSVLEQEPSKVPVQSYEDCGEELSNEVEDIRLFPRFTVQSLSCQRSGLSEGSNPKGFIYTAMMELGPPES